MFASPSVPAGAASRPRTVLVVDDETDILESLVDLLHAALERVEVISASSGTEALRRMAEQHVDLIVTDYKMPGMNGLEFLRAARAVAPEVPRILVTAFPDLDIAVRALNEEGIDHFFTKPLEPDAVIGGVRSVLDGRANQARRGAELASSFGELRRRSGVRARGDSAPSTNRG